MNTKKKKGAVVVFASLMMAGAVAAQEGTTPADQVEAEIAKVSEVAGNVIGAGLAIWAAVWGARKLKFMAEASAADLYDAGLMTEEEWEEYNDAPYTDADAYEDDNDQYLEEKYGADWQTDPELQDDFDQSKWN